MNARLVLLAFGLIACQRASATTDTSSTATVTATATATVAATATAPAPTGRTYAIRFERASKVGAKSHVVIDDERNDRTSAQVAGAPKKDTNKVVRTHVEGDVVLLELAPSGKWPLRDEMTVADFWQSKDEGAKTQLVRTGTKLSVTRAAKKQDARVTADGASATATLRSAIERVSTLTLHSGPSDDEVFGTATPRAVGEEWPVNTELAVKDLAERGLVVEKGSMSGKAKLVGARTVDGIDCLDLQVEMHVGGLRSIGEMPPGTSITNGTIDVVLHATVPVDPARTTTPQSDMTITMKGAFSLPSPKGNVSVTLDSVDYKRVTSR